jgi:hypothetical protein
MAGHVVSSCLVTVFRAYGVIQEERSIFWEVTLSVIVRKQIHVNMRLILNGYLDRFV